MIDSNIQLLYSSQHIIYSGSETIMCPCHYAFSTLKLSSSANLNGFSIISSGPLRLHTSSLFGSFLNFSSFSRYRSRIAFARPSWEAPDKLMQNRQSAQCSLHLRSWP